MKIFFDTEFYDDGKTIDLISIGMVREDGKTYYAESGEYDQSRSSPWIQKNVFPHLLNKRTPRDIIKNEIVEFSGPHPEFWTYFGAYDWVALCQLFGTMMDLPSHWPMYVMDIMQLLHPKPLKSLPSRDSVAHNALNDALWTKSAYEHIVKL